MISLNVKNFFIGALVLAAMTINPPQVFAEEGVEAFGEDVDRNVEDIFPAENPNDENFSENIPPADNPDEKTFNDDDFGDELSFVDLNKNRTEDKPAENPQPNFTQPEKNIPPSQNDVEKIIPKNEIENPPAENPPKKKKYKKQKARFVKLTADDNYTYYLDLQSVAWKRMLYSASEYIADVWIRMIERNEDTSNLPEDLAEYVGVQESEEVKLALEKGILYDPVDVEVLSHRKYFLEHYYLRPKTKQIQFLCELEVVGHPQNTISERAYDYKNWENLVPSSVESVIYETVLKKIGTGKASDKGHMTLIDMVEEYARISLR